jgi:hypothetical protein
MALEDTFLESALQCGQKVVILCDRGVMDGMAYTDDNVWQALLDETGWSTIQLRDRRYEATIHLVTAADGAPAFYTNENNEARYETIEQAIDLDKKLINAWVGHPQFSIIENKEEGGFHGKISRCIDAVFKVIGMPTLQTHHKKFLLVMPPGQIDVNTPAKVKKEVFHVQETYLQQTSDQVENFVKRTGKNDSFIYNHEVRTYQEKERIVKKRQITAREYIELCQNNKAPGFRELKKFRQCFIYEQQYFIVETILNVDGTPTFLRIETSKDKSEIMIPSFCVVLREVTEDDTYAGSTLAKSGWRMPEVDKKNIQDIASTSRTSSR